MPVGFGISGIEHELKVEEEEDGSCRLVQEKPLTLTSLSPLAWLAGRGKLFFVRFPGWRTSGKWMQEADVLTLGLISVAPLGFQFESPGRRGRILHGATSIGVLSRSSHIQIQEN